MKSLRIVAVPIIVTTLCLLSSTVAWAATCTRLATDFTLFDWNDVSKWDCGVVPGPSDIAVIPGQDDFFDPVANIALNDDITLRGLVMAGGRIEGDYTITVTEELAWSGGDLHYTNTAPFVSPSIIVIAPGAEFNVQIDDAIMTSLGTFINEGTTTWNTGTYTFSPPSITGIGSKFINNGTFRINAANGQWDTQLENHGTLIFQSTGGGKAQISVVNNHQDVTINSGTFDAGFKQITGTTTLNNGTLNAFNFSQIDLQGGRFVGKGTVRGKVVNSGAIIAPTGLLRIDGQGAFGAVYSQSGTGTLELAIKGVKRGTDYGSLSITGDASFGGALDVEFTGGFTPGDEDGFIIANCTGECSGEFASSTSALPLNYTTNLVTLGAEVELAAPLRLPYILQEDTFQR